MNFLKQKSGQIGIMPIVGIGATLIIASIGIAWNAFTKSDKAIEAATEANNGVLILQGDIKEIRKDLSWIRETLERQQGRK